MEIWLIRSWTSELQFRQLGNLEKFRLFYFRNDVTRTKHLKSKYFTRYQKRTSCSVTQNKNKTGFGVSDNTDAPNFSLNLLSPEFYI
jgi:hypothetical protein